jgi:protein-disulfide isomerase
MLGGAAAIVLVLVVAVIVLTRPDDQESAADAPVTLPPAGVEVPHDRNTAGDPNAPVKVIEWGDYQCPACAVFARQFEQRLMQEYVVPGQVFFEFRDFAFLDTRADGEESHDAAEASHCAADQGKFWEYHRTLYFNQGDAENAGFFARDRLIEMARLNGLDVDQFTTCLDDGTHEDEVVASSEEAQASNVNSTPTFSINGQVVSGANYDAIKQAIDAALAGQ